MAVQHTSLFKTSSFKTKSILLGSSQRAGLHAVDSLNNNLHYLYKSMHGYVCCVHAVS